MRLLLLSIIGLVMNTAFAIDMIEIDGKEVQPVTHGVLKTIKYCIEDNSDRVLEFTDINNDESIVDYRLSGPRDKSRDILLNACGIEFMGLRYISDTQFFIKKNKGIDLIIIDSKEVRPEVHGVLRSIEVCISDNSDRKLKFLTLNEGQSKVGYHLSGPYDERREQLLNGCGKYYAGLKDISETHFYLNSI